MERLTRGRVTRREIFKFGAGGAGMLALGASGFSIARSTAAGDPLDALDVMPTSPLILSPFGDDHLLPIPQAMRPVPESVWKSWPDAPGPDKPQDHVLGEVTDPAVLDQFATKYGWKPGTHQVWPGRGATKDFPWLSKTPLVYELPVRVGRHSWTDSQVEAIDVTGAPVAANGQAAGVAQDLPPSTIYGFNGAFPGARINAEYGRPVIIRLKNELDALPDGMQETDRQDFGAPNHAFLTHLHNGHTQPESDGQPHYSHYRFGALGRGENGDHYRKAYEPGEWVDNLYLNYPAGGDDAEKQSFLWFHDHVHGHTGANVYKGMVGLYPIYDPYGGKDMGDETKGLRLPGQRTDHGDGSFDVEYDIPLALYDVRLDDGTIVHQDAHTVGTPEAHPEWWGKHFFQHMPNHGFVGDIFTVNCKAYPVLRVKRRKYRLRFLGASIARCYNLKLMTSAGGPIASRDIPVDPALPDGPKLSGDELQGQYRVTDAEQCMQFTQIASEGGLLPTPIVRDEFEIWPALRREVVVDFSKYSSGAKSGQPTQVNDVIYLVNTMKMITGRKPDAANADPLFKVPMLKIIIEGDPPTPDRSESPLGKTLRQRPTPKKSAVELAALSTKASAQARKRYFELQRSNGGDPEQSWQINGSTFDPLAPLASVHRGDNDVWMIANGGGGWVHPMHLHQEEHHVLARNGVTQPVGKHVDDTGKMDVVPLEPKEEVAIYRSFRSFTGPYVAHCHNLAHEDHNMMFGWEILPAAGDPLPDQSPLKDDEVRNEGGGNGNPGAGAGGVAAGGAGAAVNVQPAKPAKRAKKKTAVALTCKVMHSHGRRIARCKVSDSRRKGVERIAIRILHGGKLVTVFHRSMRRGRGTFDVPLSRALKGRYQVVVVLDDGTKAGKSITIR
jgi:FtsP/CotA-like multicopper oxidase with cupredoxin domain